VTHFHASWDGTLTTHRFSLFHSCWLYVEENYCDKKTHQSISSYSRPKKYLISSADSAAAKPLQ
jgi:hypothetical protein